MKDKILISIFLLTILSSMSILSAESDLVSIGSFQQGKEVEIFQTCNNCTSLNFTRIKSPSNGTLFTNIEATQDGSYFFFVISPANFTELGEYKYCYYGTDGGSETDTGCLAFKITPSGSSGNAQIVFHVFIIIMIYAVTFLSFFYGRNIPMTILSGMFMIFLGIYLITNGIIIFRDNLTNYFSYVTIGIGFIVAFWAILEQFDVM